VSYWRSKTIRCDRGCGRRDPAWHYIPIGGWGKMELRLCDPCFLDRVKNLTRWVRF
jgi:hypothetical protein